MTSAEAAKYLSVNQATLVRWARAGAVPSHKLPGGRHLRFHTAELDIAMGLDIDAASERARNPHFTRPTQAPDEEDAA
jgi:excisionase family DNA binding protein